MSLQVTQLIGFGSTTEGAPSSGNFVTDVTTLLGAKCRAFWLYDDPTTLWQNSDATGTVSSDTDPVGYVTDLSGNSKHLIQATSGNKPAYRTGPARVRFDGSNDYLSCASAAFPIDEFELFMVFSEHTSNHNNGGIYTFAPSTGNDYDRTDALNTNVGFTAGQILRFQGSTGTSMDMLITGSDPTPLALYEARKSSTVGETFANGSAGGTDSSFTAFSSTHAGAFLNGCRYVSGVVGFYASIECRCTIMTAALTSGERSDLRNLINGRYTLY